MTSRALNATLALCMLASNALADSSDMRVVFPTSAAQGAMVIGKVPVGSTVHYANRELRVTPYGTVVFGVGRDETGTVLVEVKRPDDSTFVGEIIVVSHDWPIERVDGVPPTTVNPPPEIAARIQREQASVAKVRERDDARTDFAESFIRPVDGRISGRFGNQRVYNGNPGSAHSGMDIAAASGTPVKAPASGIVSFADADLYLTGGTVVVDHGHGISSNFLHLSRIDVAVGDRVEQGQIIAAVGATGRASGPHLHWGMSWFAVRIDPQQVLDAAN